MEEVLSIRADKDMAEEGLVPDAKLIRADIQPLKSWFIVGAIYFV